MKWFNNMKINAKMIVSFSIVVILTIIVGVVGIIGLTSMGNAADSMYYQKATPLGDLTRAVEDFQRCRVLGRDAILFSGNLDRLSTVETDINDRLTQFETSMTAYRPSIERADGIQLYDEIMDNFPSFKSGLLEAVDQAKQGGSQEDLLKIMASSTGAAEVIAKNLSALVDARLDVMGTSNAENMALQRLLFIVIIAVVAVSAVISMILALFISGLISKPLTALAASMKRAGSTGDIIPNPEDIEIIKRLSENKDEIGQTVAGSASFLGHVTHISQELENIANGDLTVEIELLSSEDTMGKALKHMVYSFSSMFGEINNISAQVSSSTKQVAETSSSIASGASQMAEGAQSLAEGAMKQTEYIDELSHSIEDISEKTRVNVNMTGQAAQLADTIMNKAEKGSRQMDEMITAVNDINEASKSVSNIMETISGIAEQTNLLALNAAIEAARAGEHGKGFAVVAEEVRKLAAQSEEAVKETSSIIRSSIEKAELGARVAGDMGVSLTEIIDGINESSRLVMEISKASGEQSQSITQINANINRVADVIQNNSAVAEENAATAEESAAAAQESAAASEEMSAQAEVMEKLIEQFKLK